MAPLARCSSLTFFQPPNTSSTVNSCTGAKSLACFAATSLSIGPVEMRGDDLLRFRRVEIVEISLGDLARTALVDDLVDDRNRKVGAQANRRDDQIDFVGSVLLADGLHLGLEGDEHIACTSRTRSFQSLMFFGLPLRTRKAGSE